MKKLEFIEVPEIENISAENVPRSMVVNAFSPYVNISKDGESDTTNYPDFKALYILNSN